ncbi:MAG TPA: response regulator [Nitrososphaeraceae archaeon]|nr:response regulator [Nitrososphaeraceae archaeon]
MKRFSSKEIRFPGDSIKGCIGFIDLVDSTKNTIIIDNIEHTRIYYSKFINSISKIVKSYCGKVIKNIGDCILFYFPKTSDNKNEKAFSDAIECSIKILESRFVINQELSKQHHLPPFNFRITMDFGILDLALVGDYSQVDLFGSTINFCAKINDSLSAANQIIIGDNFYRILKSFSNITSNYSFINNGECKITENIGYSTYNIKKVNKSTRENNSFNTYHLKKKLLGSSTKNHIGTRNKKGLSFHKKDNNKRIILIDDDKDILFTYKSFLKDNSYEIITFKNSLNALNYIKNLSDFDNLLVTLDIRMKDLNGFQLHQQINSIDPTIKIIFITALDIVEEILTIVPGLSRDQIVRKPIDKKLFTNTVNKFLN